MIDKYIASKNTLHSALEEGIQIIQILQYVPKDGVKALGLLKVAKHHKEVLPYLLKDFNNKAYDCLKNLQTIDNEYAKYQIESINEDKRKYNVSTEKLLKMIDVELEKTAYNL